MKNVIIPFLVIIAAAVIVGCGSKEKLASEVEGSWTAQPQRIPVEGQYEADIIKTYEFLPGGQFVMSAMISADKAMPATDEITAPVSLNAAATATAAGTYEAVSRDEIRINLDLASFKVIVDPAAVAIDYDALTTQEAPVAADISAKYAAELTSELTPAVKAAFIGGSSLSKIEIKGSMMKAVVGAQPATLHKQQ